MNPWKIVYSFYKMNAKHKYSKRMGLANMHVQLRQKSFTYQFLIQSLAIQRNTGLSELKRVFKVFQNRKFL